jgi:hypothetical protein
MTRNRHEIRKVPPRLVVYFIALNMLEVAYYGAVDGQRAAKTLPPRRERWKVRELSP